MAENSGTVFDPITGLCVVSSKSSCPLGYRPIDKTYDQQADADLWKDSILTTKKKERYLCLTRYFPLENGKLNNVMESIMVMNEKDEIPAGFSPLDCTYDNKEKTVKKKVLVVKMVPRFSVTEAICDLIILSRMKKAPPGFTVFGEISGLLLCFRKDVVPPASVKSVSPAPLHYILQQKDLHNSSVKKQASVAEVSTRSSVSAQTGASLARQQSRTLRKGISTSASAAYRTIEDVPFTLDGQFVQTGTQLPNFVTSNFPVLSADEIKRLFGYDFSQEKAYLASTDDMREENNLTRT